MPPPMPNSLKRFKANPVRPARYRPGKAVQEEESSEEDEEEIEEQKKPAPKPQPRAQLQKPRRPVQQEEDEDDDEEGFVTDEEEGVALDTRAKSTTASKPATVVRPVTQLPIQSGQPSAKEESEGEQSEDESEEDEESEEESSSEDEPQRKFQRPTFIRKSDRQKLPDQGDTPATSASSQHGQAASSTPDVDEQTRRLAQAELYIKDKIERDALARSQGRKAWDDDEVIDPEVQVDDTDGLDPAAEHAAWKLRELKRLKRDREAIEAREKEIEEIERRRNLTQEERDAEDRDYISKQKEQREEGRGKASYMSKYHHKGAFFQDDETAELLKKRDLMGAKFEDDVADKSALPEYMRVRDMTKLGKKGRTRYTDLKGEDTGRFGDAVKRWKGAGYERRDGQRPEDLRGVDERFLPDDDRGQNRDTNGPTGANASTVGQRRERRFSRSRSRSRSKSPRQRFSRSRSRSRSKSPRRRRQSRDRGDSYRPRRRSYSYSRSRSRSPPPRRKRSPSPHADRTKRRRVEVD